MSIFKIWFNYIRNTSLILMVLILLAFGVTKHYPSILHDLNISRFESLSFSSIGIQSYDQDETPIGSETKSTTREEKFSVLSLKGEMNSKEAKIPFLTKSGEAFLNPSDIVCIKSGKPYHTLSLERGAIIELNHRTYSLARIYEMLPDNTTFFYLKQAIINCEYIEQIVSSRGVSRIIMRNGTEIGLPDAKKSLVKDCVEGTLENFNNTVF